LRSTNARYYPDYVLDRIGVYLFSSTDNKTTATQHAERGWDIFSLDYAIQKPLTTIVTARCKSQYRKLFHLLWRLKRIEWGLNSTWRKATIIQRTLVQQLREEKRRGVHSGFFPSDRTNINNGSKLSETRHTLSQAGMTRQRILHFSSNLQSYLMLDVIQDGWDRLMKKLQHSNGNTLEDIILYHEYYLLELTSGAFLPNRKPTKQRSNGNHDDEEDDDYSHRCHLSSQLAHVLDAASQFCTVQDHLYENTLVAIRKAADRRRIAETRQEAGMWGYDTDQDDLVSPRDLQFVDESAEDVKESSDLFDEALGRFLHRLEEVLQSGGGSVDARSSLSRSKHSSGMRVKRLHESDSLRSLTFRLDFNDYYANAAIKADAAKTAAAAKEKAAEIEKAAETEDKGIDGHEKTVTTLDAFEEMMRP